MTTESLLHLSDEAINDVLIGLSAPESEAHLAACAECRSQLQAFESKMRLFNQTSLAWSEARSATLGAIDAAKARRTMPADWGLAIAAALLLAIGVPVWMHQRSPVQDQEQAVTSVEMQQDSPEQIAEDNELMQSVDTVLSASEESPINEYEMEYQIQERSGEGSKAQSRLRQQ